MKFKNTIRSIVLGVSITVMVLSATKITVIDKEMCVECGVCVNTCPEDAIELVNGEHIINQDKCTNCELCIDECPEGAIIMINNEKLER